VKYSKLLMKVPIEVDLQGGMESRDKLIPFLIVGTELNESRGWLLFS